MALKFLAAQGGEPWFLTVNHSNRTRRSIRRASTATGTIRTRCRRRCSGTRTLISRRCSERSPSSARRATRPLSHRHAQGHAVRLPGRAQRRRRRQAHYYALITHLDEQIGRPLGHLKQTGKLDDTIVLFTSDHGEMLGDHGLLYNKGCHSWITSWMTTSRTFGRVSIAVTAECSN